MSKSWKEHLLKSGVPLEYEVARILADEGMGVEADFSFLRQDVSGKKEFSVDIASTFYGCEDDGDIKFEFRALIECKYRSREKTILLLPDPNVDFPPMTLGGTVGIIDHFSEFDIRSVSFVSLEEKMKYVYKVLEVYDGGAFQEDLRHGFQQLRYAVPSYLAHMIDFDMRAHPNDVSPMFFTKILVTNAKLRLMNDGVSMSDISKSSSIEEISSELDRAIFYSDYGPDYEKHFQSAFEPGNVERLSIAKSLRKRISSSGKVLNDRTDPENFIRRMSRAERWECGKWSTQFFIVNIDGLRNLMSELKEHCNLAYDNRLFGGVEY